MVRTSVVSAIAVSVVGLASCAGMGAQKPSPPPGDWAEMDFRQRKDYMVEKVEPVMARQFKAHNAQEFADFGCQTCHGPNPGENDFEMPSPALPKLYPQGSAKMKKIAEKNPKMIKFMKNEVVPSMSTLLGLTGEGEFTCFDCHTKGEAAPAPAGGGSMGGGAAPTPKKPEPAKEGDSEEGDGEEAEDAEQAEAEAEADDGETESEEASAEGETKDAAEEKDKKSPKKK